MSSYFNKDMAQGKEFSDQAIDRLVRGFYARARCDALIGPVFEQHVQEWEPHLQRMVAFWITVLRGEAAFRPGRKSPPQIHRDLEELTPAHFRRWLQLFASVARETFPAASANVVIARSERMGRALSAHLEAS